MESETSNRKSTRAGLRIACQFVSACSTAAGDAGATEFVWASTSTPLASFNTFARSAPCAGRKPAAATFAWVVGRRAKSVNWRTPARAAALDQRTSSGITGLSPSIDASVG